MLYDAYELQKSMLAGASAMANFGAGMLQNPANPFAYFGGGSIGDWRPSSLKIAIRASTRCLQQSSPNPFPAGRARLLQR